MYIRYRKVGVYNQLLTERTLIMDSFSGLGVNQIYPEDMIELAEKIVALDL